MARRFSNTDPDFAANFTAFLHTGRDAESPVSTDVRAIINEVRKRGDAALIEYTRKFDRAEMTPQSMRLSPDEIASAVKACPDSVRQSLYIACERIREYHLRQLPHDADFTDEDGVRLGWRFTPLDSVGMYVPGGRAAYPSSVLMNAIPARAAGVRRLVMTVPAPGGELNPAVLVAAQLAQVDEIYKVGGAQAVAALAYGTNTIAPVDKIVGPGNAYVAEAKRQVFGDVGIDMIAGPSEILVVSDDKSEPRWIAADLLSQAEHDESAQSILITDSASFADKVEQEIESLLKNLPRAKIARASWENHGAVVIVKSLGEAAKIINQVAPEHLEISVEIPEAIAKDVRHAGAIFLGRYTPEAIGDYIAGPSHVLPTSRTARFSSGLSVLDFMKRSSIIACSESAFAAIGDAAEELANTEGLDAHALSLMLRRRLQ